MARGTGRPMAVLVLSCCSASLFEPPDSMRINMLPPRAASNLRA